MNRPALSRPVIRLLIVAFLGTFVAAPTPGDIGGCGGRAASTRVEPGNLNANPQETAEFMYFDRGLCAHFCWRLRECNQLCSAFDSPGEGCNNNAPETYYRCVRGGPGNELQVQHFGLAACPHTCAALGAEWRDAYEQDVLACGHAVLERACGPDGIGRVFTNAPPECASPAVCRPRR